MCAAAAGAVKTEIEDGDEVALCVMIPAPAPSEDRAPPKRGPEPQVQDQDGAEKRRRAVKTRSIHEDLQALADIPDSVRRYKGYVSHRRPVTGAERQRAMELAYAFRSSLPYCVVRMSTMHVYYSFMMVSQDVLRYLFPSCSQLDVDGGSVRSFSVCVLCSPAEVPDGVLAAAPAAGAHGRGAPGRRRQGVGGALHPQHEGPAVARLVRLRKGQLPRGRGLLRVRARRRGRVPRPCLPRRRAGRAGGQAPEHVRPGEGKDDGEARQLHGGS